MVCPIRACMISLLGFVHDFRASFAVHVEIGGELDASTAYTTIAMYNNFDIVFFLGGGGPLLSTLRVRL